MNKVSVVIVTKNRKKDLLECIVSLLKQSMKLDELLIIDNNSSDGTQEFVFSIMDKARFPMRYYLENGKGYPFIYNRGLIEAKHDWVAFIDDDCIAHFNWFAAIKSAIVQDHKQNVILGYSDTYYQKNLFSLATVFFQNLWKQKYIFGNKISNFEILDNKNIVYDRRFLSNKKLRYDESRIGYNLGAAEDCELGSRIQESGGLAMFDHQIKVYHKDPTNFPYYLKKFYFASTSYDFYKLNLKHGKIYPQKNIIFRRELLKFIQKRKLSVVNNLIFFGLCYFTVLFSWVVDLYIKILLKTRWQKKRLKYQ